MGVHSEYQLAGALRFLDEKRTGEDLHDGSEGQDVCRITVRELLSHSDNDPTLSLQEKGSPNLCWLVAACYTLGILFSGGRVSMHRWLWGGVPQVWSTF